ncbi:MAG TPA: GyrI-like domain-containing protein [Phycisphaerae bacterium]|nr:GyrI-like domain-containing protein [Phycisphaerae bacterium]HUW33870.1 GyrI-like domain-containing protein [Planctomycetota bacterium]
MMSKIDLKKELKQLYTASAKEPAIVDVPDLVCFMIDGQGDPNTSAEFQQAIEALYGTSYTLKFMLKKRGGFPDYTVMPLEGLWWADDLAAFAELRKDEWKWTLLIVQPDFVARELFEQGVAELSRKKSPPALPKLRLDVLREGRSVQIMHVGPYSAEKSTIERLHAFMQENGCTFNGPHHEVYMGDPRRTAPEKLKTILRQPVKPSR